MTGNAEYDEEQQQQWKREGTASGSSSADGSSSKNDTSSNIKNSSMQEALLDGVPPAKNVGRKRTIDESTLNPEEARKLETRRAYNRQCAAKARRRNKDLVAHLQYQVDELTRDKNELKRTNEVMRAQLDMLEQTNRQLLMNQLANGGNGGGGVGAGFMAGLVGGGGGGGLLGAAGGAGGMGGMEAMLGSGFTGGGGGANGPGGASSLLDQLTMERIAAQNRIQALQQQARFGSAAMGGTNISNQNNNN